MTYIREIRRYTNGKRIIESHEPMPMAEPKQGELRLEPKPIYFATIQIPTPQGEIVQFSFDFPSDYSLVKAFEEFDAVATASLEKAMKKAQEEKQGQIIVPNKDIVAP